MTLNEFTALVETYGANSARWPDDKREVAIAFMKTRKEDCAIVLNAEQNLDNLLDSGRLNPGTDILKARIMSSIDNQPVQSVDNTTSRRRVGSSFGHKAIAAMMLVSFSLGFGGASVLKLPVQNTDSGNYVASENPEDYLSNEWAELADDYGMGDVYDWVDSDSSGLNAP